MSREAVLAVGGSGTLGGVVSMASDDADGFCAVLTSGGVDCWGVGKSILTTAMPGVGGVGTLGGVASLAGVSTVYGSYCALLTAGGVDCWGYGYYGELGDGVFYDTTVTCMAAPIRSRWSGSMATAPSAAWRAWRAAKTVTALS